MALGTVNSVNKWFDPKKILSADDKNVPNGVAGLDENGKLPLSQLPDISGIVNACIAEHNSSDAAHSSLQTQLQAVILRLQALELKYGTKITENQFAVTFETLDKVIVTGV